MPRTNVLLSQQFLRQNFSQLNLQKIIWKRLLRLKSRPEADISANFHTEDRSGQRKAAMRHKSCQFKYTESIGPRVILG